MNLWKSFERLLPASLRRETRPLPDADYVALFAQITDDHPVWRAVLEFHRWKFAERARIVQDRSRRKEERFEAMCSALDLAAFLEELEKERVTMRKYFEEWQQQQKR